MVKYVNCRVIGANLWPGSQSSPKGQTNGKKGLFWLLFGLDFEELLTVRSMRLTLVGCVIQKVDQRGQIKDYDQNNEAAGYFLVDLASRLWLKWHNNDLYPFPYRHLERFLTVRTPCCERGFGIKLAITKNNFRAVRAVSYVVFLFFHTRFSLYERFSGCRSLKCSASEILDPHHRGLMNKICGSGSTIPKPASSALGIIKRRPYSWTGYRHFFNEQGFHFF